MAEAKNFTIDPKKKIKLKRLFFDGGNAYHPGWYEPGYLPESCLCEGLVSQEDSILDKPDYKNSITTQAISIGTNQPKTEQATFQGEKPIVAAGAKAKINVNKATVEKLVGLPNIGIATANKIVEARGTKPFADIKELSEKIELNKGSWEDLKEQLIFK